MSEADTRTVRPGYLRVAVAQIHYHPAIAKGFDDPLADPLYDLKQKRPGTSLLPPGEDAAPVPLQKRWNELRNRIRDAYTLQLGARVQGIVEACRVSGVRLLVLPEYSIPARLLSRLAPLSSGMVIVAGSHFANMAGPDADIYAALGLEGDLEALHTCNVSPVLFDGRLIALIPKLHPAKLELGVVKPGPVASWAPIALPEEFGGSLGVLICLDYLDREGDVVELARRCRLLATPTLTPTHSIADDFGPAASRDSRRLHRPVLQANLAAAGGSAVYVDEGQRTDLRRFPLHAGLLDADEEGVIVADIDTQLRPPGDSTPYAATRPVIPHAAAALVYTCVEREYAAWCADLAALLDAEEISTVRRVRAARDFIQQRQPPLPSRESARRRRLTLLLQDIAEESSLERIRQLTREILLPESIVPLAGVRAALARGAADEVHRWLEDPSLTGGAFGPVETNLRGAWTLQANLISQWSEPARRVLADVSAQVRGGPEPVPREHVELRLMRIERALIDGLDEGEPEAQTLLEKGCFLEARARFLRLLTRAEQGASEPTSPELRARIARFRLRIAAASLNLQEVELARDSLIAVDADALVLKDRLLLVEALALVGELQRAEALLPTESAIEPELRERYQAAAQTLSIFRGELPDEVVSSGLVHLRAAALALSKKDAARAAREALSALQTETGSLPTAQATHLLIEALVRTVNELPPDVVPIPVEDRGRIVDAVERCLSAVSRETLPQSVARLLAWEEPRFRALIHDEEALLNAPDPREVAPPGVEPDDSFAVDSERIFELVRERRPAEAIALLSPDDHPWRGRMQRVDLWSSGGDPGRALEEALALVQDFPRNAPAPIEYAVADLLARASRHEEALVHAERAFDELPGSGQRLLLARCLLAVGRAEEAWKLLEPARDSTRLTALRVLARVADDAGHLPEAIKFLKQAVARAPDDIDLRLALAQRLAALHRYEEAADVAWRTFEADADRLDVQGIHLCGALQVFPTADPVTAEERAGRAAWVLHERFPGDPGAEQSRWSLLQLLGKVPDDAPPIQFDRLLEAGLAHRIEGIDNLLGWMRARRDREIKLQTLARSAAIPTWAMCEQLGVSLPRFLTRLLDQRADTITPLCPPIRGADVSLLELRGATILLSDLEIVLLHALDRDGAMGLWRNFRKTVAGGTMVIPAAAHRRIHLAVEATFGGDRRTLERYDQWLSQIDRLPTPEGRTDELEDTSVAKRLGLPVVETTAPAGVRRVSPRALLSRLERDGMLDALRCRAIERALPEEEGVAEPLPEPLPRLLLGAEILRAILENDALPEVARAFPSGVVLGPIAVAALREERKDLAGRLQVAALADIVHRAVAEAHEAGLLRVLPDVEPSMPAPRAGASAAERALVVEPAREALGIHEALEKNPAWIRVTADFFGSSVIATPGLPRTLPWSRDELHRVMARMRQLETRTVSVPDLVRALAKGEKARETALNVLAELGFPDALNPSDMLVLARRFGGLDKVEPARLLGRQEWIAASAEHIGGDAARLWLSRTYSDMLFDGFATGEGQHSVHLSGAEKAALVRAVLSRAEKIDTQAKVNMLDLTLGWLGTTTMSRYRWSWVPGPGGARINEQGPVASLWRAVVEWVGSEPTRRGALGRAVREQWVLLDRIYDDPGDVQVVTLHQVGAERLAGWSSNRYFLEPEIEPLAILSALWPHVTLLRKEGQKGTGRETGASFEMTHEDLLEHGVRLLEEPHALTLDARSVTYEMPVLDGRGVISARVPVEALLLRANAARRPFAAELKAVQGPHDGALYTLLEAIEEAPDDHGHLRAYARRAATALFRLVRDDPSYLARWPRSRRLSDGEVPSLDDLKQILSEPAVDSVETGPPSKWLGKRVQAGEWSNRADRLELFLRASEIPGLLPGLHARVRLELPHFEHQVAIALMRLDRCEQEPIARIAGDVLFLRAAAAQRPRVRLPQGEIDLNEELPARFVRLLDAVCSEPKEDTMAACEAPLLRLCADVVARLAANRPLPSRDRLWLTYRLFQWLCAQLEALAPDARSDAFKRLSAVAPPAHETAELLDPMGFDRNRFDHRSAAILHALVLAEDLAPGLMKAEAGPEPGADSEPRRPAIQGLSSPELETRLAAMAQRPATPGRASSELDWGSLDNVPDLALLALLRLNSLALNRVSVEARLRRWETVPLEPVEGSPEAAFATRLLLAFAERPKELRDEERAAIERRVRAMPESEAASWWRWVAWIGLFAAGEHRLEEEVRALTEQHMHDRLASVLAGRYLAAAVAAAPERLAREVHWLRGAAERAGTNVVDVTVTAVVRVALHGTPATKQAAFDLLRQLAREAPFAEDPGMHDVVSFFNLGETSS